LNKKNTIVIIFLVVNYADEIPQRKNYLSMKNYRSCSPAGKAGLTRASV
jgi:hypothetical protein